MTNNCKQMKKPTMKQQQEATSDNPRSGAIRKLRADVEDDDEIEEPDSQSSGWLENNRNPDKNSKVQSRQCAREESNRLQVRTHQSTDRVTAPTKVVKNGISDQKTYGNGHASRIGARTRTEAVPTRKYDSEAYETKNDTDQRVRKKSKHTGNRNDGPAVVIDLAGEVSSDSEAERTEGEKVKSAKAILCLNQTITGEAEQLKIPFDSLTGNLSVVCNPA